MQELKLYFISAAFVCLTVLKLCFPGLPGQLKEELYRLMGCQVDYGQMIQALGRSAATGEADKRLTEAMQLLQPGSSFSGLISAMEQEDTPSRLLETLP